MPILNPHKNMFAALTLGVLGLGCGPESLQHTSPGQVSSLNTSPTWTPNVLMRGGTTGDNDELLDVVVTSSGNVIVGGYDNGKRGLSSVDPSGNAVGVILEYKYEADQGKLVLQANTKEGLSNSSAEVIEALALRPNAGGPALKEDVYFVGRTNGQLTATPNAGQFDLFAGWWNREDGSKYRAQFGDQRPQHPLRLGFDKAGDMVISGFNDTYVPSNYVEEWEDPFIIKLHKAGGQLEVAADWPKPAGNGRWTAVQFNTPGTDFMPGMCVNNPATGASTIFVTGAITNGTERGMFVREYQTTGTPGWVKQPTTISLDMAAAASMTNDGSRLLVAGSTYARLGTAQFGDQDAIVESRHPTTGEREWVQQYGSPGNDWVTDMAVDSQGNIYLVGETLGSFPGFTNAGDYDVFVIKLNASGLNPQYFQVGSSMDDHPSAVAVDNNGNVYVVGYTTGTLNPAVPNKGQRDGFILRLAPEEVTASCHATAL